MWAKLKARLTRKLVTVNFYMKSGNIIVCDRVETKMKYNVVGNEVTGITHWAQHNPKNRLSVTAMALDQIEAITFND